MDDHDHTTGLEGGKDSTVSGSGTGNGSECVSGVNESLKHLTIDAATVTNDSKETETLSTCEKIDKSLKTLYSLLERSKILLAHEECVRLQDIFAFASSGDHSPACPLRNECPLFNDEQRKSLQEIFDKLVIRSAEINDVMAGSLRLIIKKKVNKLLFAANFTKAIGKLKLKSLILFEKKKQF